MSSRRLTQVTASVRRQFIPEDASTSLADADQRGTYRLNPRNYPRASASTGLLGRKAEAIEDYGAIRSGPSDASRLNTLPATGRSGS